MVKNLKKVLILRRRPRPWAGVFAQDSARRAIKQGPRACPRGSMCLPSVDTEVSCFHGQAAKGFTLVEVLFAAVILAVALCGFLLTYLHMFTFTDLIRDSALAESVLRAKAEEIRNMNFDNLSLANGPFNLTDYGFPYAQSRGSVEVTPSFSGYTSTLTKVRITATYLSRNRTIGEDKNFNGVLESSEDKNNNTRLDSSVELVTLISK